jgi:hypothetical protein
MTIKISVAAAIAACDTLVDLIDVGGTANHLRIYSGTEPATADTALSGNTMLVNFDLPDPSFGAAVSANGGGTATLNTTSPVTAAATGTATFFRVLAGDGTTVIMQGSVSDTGGSGDLKLSSTAIVSGIDVEIVSMTVTLPAT